jgi:hypothetical protein
MLALTIVVVFALPLLTQGLVVIRAEPACPSCSIELSKVATLGAAEGPGELGVQPSINAAADDRFYVFDPTVEPGKILVFDRAGRFLAVFGRSGDGPGEYSRPFHVIARARTHCR